MTPLLIAVKPKNLFLIDGIGALTTAALLYFVVGRWDSLFGMPSDIVSLLAFIALGFAAYSMVCFLSIPRQWKRFLALIATANSLYCVATLTLCILHRDAVTALGWAYFLGEIAIVMALVTLEFRTARSK